MDVRDAGHPYEDLIERARRAKAAREAAEKEWLAVEAELRALAGRGGLSGEQESEIASLIGEDPHAPHRGRWRPAPS